MQRQSSADLCKTCIGPGRRRGQTCSSLQPQHTIGYHCHAKPRISHRRRRKYGPQSTARLSLLPCSSSALRWLAPPRCGEFNAPCRADCSERRRQRLGATRLSATAWPRWCCFAEARPYCWPSWLTSANIAATYAALHGSARAYAESPAAITRTAHPSFSGEQPNSPIWPLMSTTWPPASTCSTPTSNTRPWLAPVNWYDPNG